MPTTKKGNLLVIDDEKDLLNLLSKTLELEDYVVHKAETGKHGLKILAEQPVDVVLTDIRLPDQSGLELVGIIRQKYPYIQTICLTAFGRISDGVKAIQSGAFDYLVKGDDNARIIPLVARAMEKSRLVSRLQRLEAQLGKAKGFETIIGNTPALKNSIELAKKVARTDTTVLLTGETGTGKEVFAQAIHQHSQRNQEEFVAINCSAISKELLESELFGHAAGAFTGANKEKKGLLEAAEKGTLFLDEIGDMEYTLQAKLLRTLEMGTYFRVGDSRERKMDVRIIAATNRDLRKEIEQGQFREDLYFRLNVFEIRMPSLQERKEDIPLLARHFLDTLGPRLNPGIQTISPALDEALKQHVWKGNVRELKNVIERALILAEGTELHPHHLHHTFKTTPSTAGTTLRDMEKEHIQRMLLEQGGNKTQTAQALGIGLTTLYAKIKEYGIEP